MVWLFLLIVLLEMDKGAGERMFDEREVRNGEVRVVVGYVKGDAFTLTIKGAFGAWVDVRYVATWEAACQEMLDNGIQPPPVNTSWRSMEWQKELRARYLRGEGSLAAEPGYSDHQAGRALDLGASPGRDYIKAHAARLGFSFNVASEPWHCVLTREGSV